MTSLKAKVADTPSTLEQGLMYVQHLDPDEGMVFVFNKPRKLSFWGKNTFIPLDIAFVDGHDVIHKIAKIKPMCLDAVASDTECVMAIEANAGYFDWNGVKDGDKIAIDWGDKKCAFISFTKSSKDSAGKETKIKESQVVEDAIRKPHPPEPVGVPIEEETGMPEENLPVLDISNLDQYLEDEYDQEEETPEDALDGRIDEIPEEVEPQPLEEEITEPMPEEKAPEYPVFDNVFDATDWAQTNNEVVRVNYTTKRGRQLIRDIEPHGKFHSDTTKREILVSYDETISGIRAFILANIGNWAFVGRKFQKKFIVKA